MRRQRRRARNTGHKISKVSESALAYSYDPDTSKKDNGAAILEVTDEEDLARAELVSRLNEAVAKWKEEKDLPVEKKESRISKVLKVLSRKEKRDKRDFEEARSFLEKIRNFNPTDTEDINLDDITPEKVVHKSNHHHQKNIEGEKLVVELKDRPQNIEDTESIDVVQEMDLNEAEKTQEHKYKGLTGKKERFRKEIKSAIKAHHKHNKKVFDKGSLHIEVSDVDSCEEPLKSVVVKDAKQETGRIDKEHTKKRQKNSSDQDYRIRLKEFRKAFEKKAAEISKSMAKGLKGTYASLKERIDERKRQIEGQIKRQVFNKVREKKEARKAKAQALLDKKKKKKELDAAIEKIYKEIEQV